MHRPFKIIGLIILAAFMENSQAQYQVSEGVVHANIDEMLLQLSDEDIEFRLNAMAKTSFEQAIAEFSQAERILIKELEEHPLYFFEVSAFVHSSKVSVVEAGLSGKLDDGLGVFALNHIYGPSNDAIDRINQFNFHLMEVSSRASQRVIKGRFQIGSTFTACRSGVLSNNYDVEVCERLAHQMVDQAETAFWSREISHEVYRKMLDTIERMQVQIVNEEIQNIGTRREKATALRDDESLAQHLKREGETDLGHGVERDVNTDEDPSGVGF